MSQFATRTQRIVYTCGLFIIAAVIGLIPFQAFAGEPLLLDAPSLAVKLKAAPDYQLLDARDVKARQLFPLAFSKRYEKGMVVNLGVVFVIAEQDSEALAVAQSISPAEGRQVFAVQDGIAGWRRAQSQLPSVPAPTNFIVPKGTCGLGKPAIEFKAPTGQPVRGDTIRH